MPIQVSRKGGRLARGFFGGGRPIAGPPRRRSVGTPQTRRGAKRASDVPGSSTGASLSCGGVAGSPHCGSGPFFPLRSLRETQLWRCPRRDYPRVAFCYSCSHHTTSAVRFAAVVTETVFSILPVFQPALSFFSRTVDIIPPA